MLAKKIKIPIYRLQLMIIIYNDPGEIRKFVKKKYGRDHDFSERIGWFFNIDDVQHVCIDSENMSPGIIAHECKHAVNDLYQQIGARLDTENDEHECYLLMWYIDEVQKLIEDY